MHLNIDIDTQKSSLFLDFLNLLKKDKLINDFKVIPQISHLSSYEKELLHDISQLSTAITQADEGKGKKKDLAITL
jgi:hypothetical protein